jgi:flagellum-specific ATP synthase
MTAAALSDVIARVPALTTYGRVAAVQGLLVELGGIQSMMSIGGRATIRARDGRSIPCEAIGFRNGRVLAMPFGTLDGVALGCRAELDELDPVVFPDHGWLGRVVNAFGDPVDGGPQMRRGQAAYKLRAVAPPAHARRLVEGKIDLGVRSINTFLTCCKGQRMGIFAGSGVGKSTVLSMMVRNTQADVTIVGLIGERGREVQEFITNDLGPEGLKRAIVVVATSDESPLMRRQAAYLTMALAEYFRDLGLNVLLLMDSVTRFAMAQREIGLSAGEPPASKGYTPSVFAELPKLLERAGPGVGAGTITGLFSVLVEGDDHNEPITDAVRGIIDGHIVLERKIAERGRYPAVNILRSVSRTMPDCNSDDENALVARARVLIARYEDMAELIRVGAYRHGADPEIDEAIRYHDALEAFLGQGKAEQVSMADGYRQLQALLG